MRNMSYMNSVGAGQSRSQPLRADEDMVHLRKLVRELSVEAGLGLVDQTKMITASSEIARNTLKYGNGGEALISIVSNGAQHGVRVEFLDQGPGIPDLQLALSDGYTTGNGLGLGLGGTKRLVDEFNISSEVGKGTTVTIVKWKR
jgi:serine/threonine-protein kinase RsbT